MKACDGRQNRLRDSDRRESRAAAQYRHAGHGRSPGFSEGAADHQHVAESYPCLKPPVAGRSGARSPEHVIRFNRKEETTASSGEPIGAMEVVPASGRRKHALDAAR